METSRRSTMITGADLAPRIVDALRPHFKQDTVDVSPGYHDNVHVVMFSRNFNNMGEKEKQDYLWSLIDHSDLSEAEKLRISLILPYTPAELK